MIEKLKFNPKNPRQITPEALERLKESIRTFPKMLELRPIVYDKDFIVLGGNQRLRALTELVEEGFEVKDSYFVAAKDLTPEEIAMFVIKDNISDGEWDQEMLKAEWGHLPLKAWGVPVKDWETKEPKNSEVDTNALGDDLNCECPKCGFKFKFDKPKQDV